MSAAERLISEGRLLITAGAGGVGKTTTAAALAVTAAARGRRTAVITIDPARRLADALGLDALTNAPTQVDPALFEASGLHGAAPLHALMLDMKSTSDDMVRRFAPSDEQAERIFANPYYQSFSSALPGTQEYMAIERVHGLVRSGAFDLVVLDTPPAVHALDFLDAPDRLLSALDNKAVDWVLRGREGGLLGRSANLIFRALNKMTGGPFLQDLATFLSTFSVLFDAFKASSRGVYALLREPTSAFMMVTTPHPGAIEEAEAFLEQLASRDLHCGALVLNRVHEDRPLDPSTLGPVRAAISALPASDQATLQRLMVQMEAGWAAHQRMARRDAEMLQALDRPHLPPNIRIPLFAEDVYALSDLHRIGEFMLG
ncbi:MAG: ArsA family ATPase [Bradymonadia bacterium]